MQRIMTSLLLQVLLLCGFACAARGVKFEDIAKALNFPNKDGVSQRASSGLTGELCTSSAACAGDRKCFDLVFLEFCSGVCDGACLPTNLDKILCSCSENACSDGDVCLVPEEETPGIGGVCGAPSLEGLGAKPIECAGTTSESSSAPASGAAPSSEPSSAPTPASPSNSSSPSNVCIGADMLSSFASHELVFEKHVLARVLCDSSNSCATKGHMVHFNGSAMMMGSYCEIVGCTEEVMAVNSPKYRRGLKVESKSEGMHFTAFAARYETRGEEAVLSTAVRMGL